MKESWQFKSTKDFCVENISNMGKPKEVSQIYITKKASKNDWKSEYKMFEEKNSYYPIGDAYLHIVITVRRFEDANVTNTSLFNLVENVLLFCFNTADFNQLMFLEIFSNLLERIPANWELSYQKKVT